MYTSFSIKNFRAFEHLELNDLARINLIAGKNNTGKTSILEAIQMHSGNFREETIIRFQPIINERRIPSRPAIPIYPNVDWRIIFTDFNTSEKIVISGMYKQKYTQPSLLPEQQKLFPNMPREMEISIADTNEDAYGYRRIRRGNLDAIERFFQDRVVLKIRIQEHNYYVTQVEGEIVFDRVLPILFPLISIPSREQISLGENATRFSQIDRMGRQEILIDALRVIEPRLQELKLYYDGEPPIIHGNIGLKEPIPLAIMGEGIGRITSLILAIGSASGGVVTIDEIENGLHYSVMTEVWKAIGKAAREFDVQIFATTHSLECIRAAHDAFSESETYDFRYHRLDRKSTGEIQAVTFDREMLETAREANFEVR